MILRRLACAAALMFPATLAVSEEHEAGWGFVEANILGIFYHELGHAVIDLEEVPIFAQEEDAADIFSIFMIDALFEEETAQELAYSAALGFLAEAQARDEEGFELAWWDVHGLDEQRFFNTVCLFYGADPETREDFAEDLELPEDRAETCPEEYDAAAHSWGSVLDEMVEAGPGDSLILDGMDGSLTAEILIEEVAALNEEFSLSAPLTIAIESCGEANAFYDPAEARIIMCSEFEDHLIELEDKL